MDHTMESSFAHSFSEEGFNGERQSIILKVHHYLFNTSRVYTVVKRTLKQNYIQLHVS